MFFIVEVDDGQIKLTDASGNIVTTTDLGSSKRGLDVNAILAAGGKIIIRDGTNENLLAKVNDSGYLYVVTPPPTTPPGKTEVMRSVRGSVSGLGYNDNTYTIPNGVTLNLTYFEGGAQGTSYESAVILYYAPDGTVNANAVILGLGYVNNATYSKALNMSYVGNGTRAIITRRQRFDGVAKDMYFMWQGWY